MKTILKSKLLMIVLLIGLSISCKTTSDNSVKTDSDAIKAGDSTSLNTGTKGTTRANEGNEPSDPAPGDVKSTPKDTTAVPKN